MWCLCVITTVALYRLFQPCMYYYCTIIPLGWLEFSQLLGMPLFVCSHHHFLQNFLIVLSKRASWARCSAERPRQPVDWLKVSSPCAALINHDCLPILMLLYTMLYILLAYLMLFAALSNAVCVYNAFFLLLIFANAFCFMLCLGLLIFYHAQCF